MEQIQPPTPNPMEIGNSPEMEKYIRIKEEWPSMAIHVKMLLEAQRRLVDRLARTHKPTEDMKTLLVTAADVYDSADHLLSWTHVLLNDVARDYKGLADIAKLRATLNFQSALLKEYLENDNKLPSKK